MLTYWKDEGGFGENAASKFTVAPAHEVSQVLRFEGEVVVGWDMVGYGYDHSYCLVYSAL